MFKKIIAAIAAAVLSVGVLATTVSADEGLWVNMEDTYLGDMYTYFKDSKPENLRKEAITKKDVEEIFDVKVAIDEAQLNMDLGTSREWLEYGSGTLNCYLTMTPKKNTDYTSVDYYVRVVSVDGKALNFGYKKPKGIDGINGKYGAFTPYESFSDITETIGMYGGSLSDIYYAEFSIVGLFRADGQGEPVADCTYRAYYPGSSKKAPSSISSSSTADTKQSTPAVKTTNVKFTKSVGSEQFTIKWNKFGSAGAYGIYLYNASTQKYEFYKTVKGTQYTFKNLKKDTKYSFYVAALEKKNGKYYVKERSQAVAVRTKSIKKVNLTEAEYKELVSSDGTLDIITLEECEYYYNGKKVG